MKHALVLAIALISWPILAGEPPAPVKTPAAPEALTLPALAPLPKPPASSDPSHPDPASKPAAEPAQPKDDVPAPSAAPLGPTLSSFPPLGQLGEPGNTYVSLGGWLTANTGSITKTGEYQGMSSSPFWIIDGLYSSGYRTLGIYGNETDNESIVGGIHYYQPRVFADINYQQFIHRLDHVPLSNFTPSNAVNDSTNFPANSTALGKDLNPGEDYAIRVEELKGSTGWRINDNVRVRVDFWELHKFGDRQANATAHCFVAAKGGSSNCHVLSQSQHIDWTTMELTPRVEARFGPATLEYSRPMRQFTASDQIVFRDYNNGSLTVPKSTGGMIWGTYPYAMVPDSLTQIDQFKGSLDLGPTRQFYAFGYFGNTNNQFRDVTRDFYGADVRFTDWTLPRTSTTVYFKTYNQTGNRPTSFLADGSETQFLTPEKANAEIRSPIEYHRNTAGIKGNWRPDIDSGALRYLTIQAGYEFDALNRDNAIWQTPFLSSPGSPAGSQEVGVFGQPTTFTNSFFVGARKPWGYNIDTFVRYKVHLVDDVLYGFRELSNVLNTALPQQQHIVEFGGGWYPTGYFAISLDQNVVVGQTHNDNTAAAAGNIVDFREQSYATTLTVTYAPTLRLSMVASTSVYSDWINQNVFLGDDYVDPDDPLPLKNPKTMPLVTQPTFYAGISELFNMLMHYRLTSNTRLTLGYQFVHGSNQFNMNANPSFAFSPSLSTSEPKGPLTYSDLGPLSREIMDTNKLTAGVAWRFRPRATVGFFYDFFAYLDEVNRANNGIAHQVNTNLSWIW